MNLRKRVKTDTFQNNRSETTNIPTNYYYPRDFINDLKFEIVRHLKRKKPKIFFKMRLSSKDFNYLKKYNIGKKFKVLEEFDEKHEIYLLKHSFDFHNQIIIKDQTFQMRLLNSVRVKMNSDDGKTTTIFRGHVLQVTFDQKKLVTIDEDLDRILEEYC